MSIYDLKNWGFHTEITLSRCNIITLDVLESDTALTHNLFVLVSYIPIVGTLYGLVKLIQLIYLRIRVGSPESILKTAAKAPKGKSLNAAISLPGNKNFYLSILRYFIILTSLGIILLPFDIIISIVRYKCIKAGN